MNESGNGKAKANGKGTSKQEIVFMLSMLFGMMLMQSTFGSRGRSGGS